MKFTIKYFLWRLFYSQINTMAETRANELRRQDINNRVEINYPIGQRVIIRSNEPGDLFIGDVISYRESKSNGLYLTIQDDNGAVITTFDQSPPYWSYEREAALRKLNWAEQWNVMSKYYDISVDHQIARENAVKDKQNEKK